MIRINILSGPQAGDVGEFAGTKSLRAGIDIDPTEALTALVLRGETWEIDFLSATSEETFLWTRADFVVRIMRALQNEVPVEFNGHMFHGLAEAGVLDDAISESGLNVRIDVDDGVRFVIESFGDGTPEQ